MNSWWERFVKARTRVVVVVVGCRVCGGKKKGEGKEREARVLNAV